MQTNTSSSFKDDNVVIIKKNLQFPVVNRNLHPSGIWTSKNYTKKLVAEVY